MVEKAKDRLRDLLGAADVQAIVTLTLTVGVLVMVGLGRVDPENIVAGWLMAMGFYFGTKK